MAANAITIAEAAVGSRIVFSGPDSPLEGAFRLRETNPLDLGKVAVVLQPVDGGADVEATLPGDTSVSVVSD